MHGEVPMGAPLLKLILREANVDTRATTNVIRLKIKELEEYIATIDYDVPCPLDTGKM